MSTTGGMLLSPSSGRDSTVCAFALEDFDVFVAAIVTAAGAGAGGASTLFAAETTGDWSGENGVMSVSRSPFEVERTAAGEGVSRLGATADVDNAGTLDVVASGLDDERGLLEAGVEGPFDRGPAPLRLFLLIVLRGSGARLAL